MSRRLLVLPLLLSILVGGAAARLAAGATPVAIPSIAAKPNPKTAGQGLIISGRVPGASAGVPVTLWERPALRSRFAPGQVVVTDATGRYAFIRPGDAVDTNRSYYVVAGGHRSRTVLELVHALITLSTSSGSVDPGTVVTFTGHVTPNHAGQRILFERSTPIGGLFLARPRIGADSSFTVRLRLTGAGDQTFRAALPGDARNLASVSQAAIVSVGAQGIHKIKHVVIIMQENRSFDTTSGPSAERTGSRRRRLRARIRQRWLRPSRSMTRADLNYGGPHGAPTAAADINGGNMDGFVGQAETGQSARRPTRAAARARRAAAGKCST